MTSTARPLRELLEDPARFTVLAELVTGRGLITDRRAGDVLRLGRELVGNPRIDAVSITDNAGGQPMLSPDTLATDLLSRGQEVVVHVTCKDANRSALISRGWKLASEGFRNLLCLTGDYPVSGFAGTAAPVFDIDSVGLLELYSRMNAGHPIVDGSRDEPSRGTAFCLGAVVNNHKRREREVVPQYLKLVAKIHAGARFVITQVAYNARKHDELRRFLIHRGLDMPLVGNVFLLSPGAARHFHAGRIPGCVVNDELLDLVERHARSPDHGRGFFLDFAARQIAIFRGLGYRGVYLGGHLKADEYDVVLDLADGYRGSDWRDLARDVRFGFHDEFYLFEADPQTGLSSDELSAAYVRSISPHARRAARRRAPLIYRFSRRVHEAAFAPGTPGFRAGAAAYGTIERSLPVLGRPLHVLEQATKVALFDCRDCGDCSLPEIAYLCPESQCVKNQRNGPCGGTRDGKCEVGDKECIWARAYDRLKPYGEEGAMLERPAVFKDGALRGTSAWANACLGRDHTARLRPGLGRQHGEERPGSRVTS